MQDLRAKVEEDWLGRQHGATDRMGICAGWAITLWQGDIRSRNSTSVAFKATTVGPREAGKRVSVFLLNIHWWLDTSSYPSASEQETSGVQPYDHGYS